MQFALIPVKELSQAKVRLAPALDAAGRRELTVAMLRDVLAAALACPVLDKVAVVTRDADVLTLAKDAGAEGLPEPGGLNEALTSAGETLAQRGVDRLLVLAADLPLVATDDIATVAQADADVVIVPSMDGGTNALALPPSGIAFRFGPDSARRHLAAAAVADLRSLTLDLPAISFDVDTPQHVDHLRAAIVAGEAPIGANTRLLFEKTPSMTGR